MWVDGGGCLWMVPGAVGPCVLSLAGHQRLVAKILWA